MGRLRFLFALWMAKLSVPALKITHHDGTDFPGSLACERKKGPQQPGGLQYVVRHRHHAAARLRFGR